MNTRIGSGWQTLMADLSMVLFMISAAAVGEAPADKPKSPPPLAASLPALGEPVAVWRGGGDPQALRAWLSSQSADPRQRLTIVAAQADAPAALALAAGVGRPARVLIEPQGEGGVFAALTYDQDPALARGLQDEAGRPATPEPQP